MKWPNEKKTDNKMVKRKRQPMIWPKEKRHNKMAKRKRTENKMPNKNGHTIKWPN